MVDRRSFRLGEGSAHGQFVFEAAAILYKRRRKPERVLLEVQLVIMSLRIQAFAGAKLASDNELTGGRQVRHKSNGHIDTVRLLLGGRF
jgi:hypothetical protein